MPTSDYDCPGCGGCGGCGGFDAFRTLAQRNEPAVCPDCGAASERVFVSAPRLALMDGGTRTAIGVNERARHEPQSSRDYQRMRHPAGCGCCSTSGARGFTQTWPYHCGNLFPCRSEPALGGQLSVEIVDAPAGQRAILPLTSLADAPAYQLAWAIGPYADIDLGRTPAGTRLVASHLPGEREDMLRGSRHLVAVFGWLESTLGPYRFGPQAGPVSVAWGVGAGGGMEHHPRWHLAAGSVADAELHMHEAVHGWFGNGVRLACWEDFVLSEGTSTYLTARALEAVAPAEGAALWADYAVRLRSVGGDQPVWPQSCGQVDILRDGLYSRAPYIRGAYFYRALSLRLGASELDRVLGVFYRARAGTAARMQDMLDTVRQETGYDATACARAWLRSATVPQPGPCS